MDLNNFVGKRRDIDPIENWFIEPYSKQIVIQGQPGNGKTLLVTILADKYEYELQTIDPYDFTNMSEFNNILKTVNLLPIESQKTKKVILIENINEFHSNYRKRLFELHSLCRFPIVITGLNINIPQEYRNKLKVFRIEKPLSSLIHQFLREKIKELDVEIDDDMLRTIAQESPSIRSAINSLYNSSPNDITNPIPTFYEQVNNIKYRKLNENINRRLLHFIFGNITDYNSMNLLANFDFEFGKTYKTEIDRFIFNNMSFKFKQRLSYPNFMQKHFDDKYKYKKYCKELHVSSRIVKREFAELLEKLSTIKKPSKQESIKKITTFKNSQNILDFV